MIAVQFSKPIYKILEGAGAHTCLLINDPAYNGVEICEKVESLFDSTTYKIKYTHKLQHFRIYCFKQGQEFPSLLSEIPASWEAPEYDEQGQADPQLIQLSPHLLEIRFGGVHQTGGGADLLKHRGRESRHRQLHDRFHQGLVARDHTADARATGRKSTWRALTLGPVQ